MRKEKSCGAVLFRREGKKTYFLLLKYFGDYYDFPKGNQEKGEGELDTVLREVEEETNIANINIIKGFNQVIRYFYQRDKNIVHKEVSYYLAETSSKDVRVSYEHKGFKWLEFDEAMETLKFENSRGLLRKAKEFMENTLFKYDKN